MQRQIADNLARVRDDIARTTGGRHVALVCVTKYAPAEHAAALVLAGAEHLGENLLPQGGEKFAVLRGQGLHFTGHMLGPLQSRKVKDCAASCDWYQALERVEIAAKLSAELERVGRTMDVLIQVHIGEEETKHGVEVGEVERFVQELTQHANVLADLASAREDEDNVAVASNTAGGDKLPPYGPGTATATSATGEGARATDVGYIRVRGLMCIPPGPSCFLSPKVYEATTRGNFRQMADLFAKIRAGYSELPIDTLSMGMSSDYRWAIEEGATMVRIGRALFEGLS